MGDGLSSFHNLQKKSIKNFTSEIPPVDFIDKIDRLLSINALKTSTNSLSMTISPLGSEKFLYSFL